MPGPRVGLSALASGGRNKIGGGLPEGGGGPSKKGSFITLSFPSSSSSSSGNAIQAFGNGTDLTFSRKALPQPLLTLPPSVGRASALPYSVNDSSLVDNTSVSITCTSPQVRP